MSTIVIAEQVRIPSWVNGLESFRRWSPSRAYPERGRISFLNSEIWVDMSMEQLFVHNCVKTPFTIILGSLIENKELEYHFSDRALLSNEDANFSTGPDGTFCSFAAIEDKRVSLMEGKEEEHVGIAGAPDMVPEIISTYSVRKDTKILRNLYWRAGIPEHWLVDARKTPQQFDTCVGRGAATPLRSANRVGCRRTGSAGPLFWKRNRIAWAMRSSSCAWGPPALLNKCA